MSRPRKYNTNEQIDEFDELYRRIAVATSEVESLEKRLRNMGGSPLPRLDIVGYPYPFEGQRAIDVADEQHAWYSNGEWRKAGGNAIYQIELFEIDIPVTTGDIFEFEIPEDLDDAELVRVESYVTTASGSGSVTIQFTNETTANNLLSTMLTIDAGDLNSKDATVPAVINAGNAIVSWGDHIVVDVVNAGSGATGAGCILYFDPAPTGAVRIVGEQGPPGGVTDFTGNWTNTTVYNAGDIVVHNGVVYVALQDHTSNAANDEPGVGTNEANFWQELIDLPITASVNATISASGVIAPGTKGAVRMPFAGTITEATILADIPGNATVDIWKSTYAGYPPNSGNSITGATPLVLSSAVKNTDTALVGWTTSLAQGDILVPYVSGVLVINRLSLSLKITKT